MVFLVVKNDLCQSSETLSLYSLTTRRWLGISSVATEWMNAMWSTQVQITALISMVTAPYQES